MVETVNLDSKRISKSNCWHGCEKYRGRDTPSQKDIKSHVALLGEIQCDVPYDRIDTLKMYVTIVEADSRLEFQT